MFKKKFRPYTLFTLLVFLTLFTYAGNIGFEYDGIKIKTTNTQGKTEYFVVKRDIPEICKQVPINNEMVWTGFYANKKVPKECKSIYVHTTGKLLPIQLHDEIETYGELEVLAFMKQMQEDDTMMLVDARKEPWFDYRTIPGAVNLPFYHFKERDAFEFDQALVTLGVTTKKDDTFDFSAAKSIVIFCNGPWCSQSVVMIVNRE